MSFTFTRARITNRPATASQSGDTKVESADAQDTPAAASANRYEDADLVDVGLVNDDVVRLEPSIPPSPEQAPSKFGAGNDGQECC